MSLRFSSRPPVPIQGELKVNTQSPISMGSSGERQHALLRVSERKWGIIVRTSTFRDDRSGIQYSTWEPLKDETGKEIRLKWQDALKFFIELKRVKK